ncbi:MAG: hypothetical protein JWN40_1986 [Phycisphaerales bacterium]|nr:hypothetical protein [Phycisphaerales bacterium]
MIRSRFAKTASVATLGLLLSLAPNTVAQTSAGNGGGSTGTGTTSTGGGSTSAGRSDDNRGFDWGWLGLLGLVGLAGMRRPHTHDARERNMGTARA